MYKYIEGFRPAVIIRAEEPLKYEPLAVSGANLKSASRGHYLKLRAVNETAADLLNTFEILFPGKDYEVILSEQISDEIYFARKKFINVCGFVGIEFSDDPALLDCARSLVKDAPSETVPNTPQPTTGMLFRI